MADDTEKRFHSIMEKLFQSPKSNLSLPSSSPSEQNTRGQKRPHSATKPISRGDKGDVISSVSHAPPCRPWDRGDLMRRLATFKSMRWFAKPKVVDAISCARRGWVNVDMDIIACEVCGSRLQFSTPSAWSKQQVEKAALVFSLKLDTGHKLLCPWIDNACDENLALFPPLPAPALVDQYKKRSAALLQLSSLPVMSTSALEDMRFPQLEHFLKQSIAVECGAGPTGSSWTEILGNDVEAVSSDLYYQAHRLLSLCGWEPRLLPYMVECDEQPKHATSNSDISGLSHVAAGEQNSRLSVYASGSDESVKGNEDVVASSVNYDPNSIVLDCKLCGASIGLWAFATVPRPLELIRVVGYAEVDGRGNLGTKEFAIENHANNGKSDSLSTANKEVTPSREPMLNLTIAGGPPPTKQNFRAKISLPVVGRNVRARFSYMSSEVMSASKDGPIIEGSIDNVQNVERDSVNTNNLPAVEGSVGDFDSQAASASDSGAGTQDKVETLIGNGVQSEISEGSNLQQMPIDDTTLRKDTSSVPSGGLKENGAGEMAKSALQNYVSTTSIDKDPSPSSHKKMEFHPIRHHRHFCPWVASTDTTAPGWKQTLLALQKEKVFSLPESQGSPSSPSFIKVDDPITSIRKLFESPTSKRAKPTST